MLLITELTSVAEKARALWFPTDKLCTEGTGTVIKESVINEVISYSSCESETSVKSPELSIIVHGSVVMSDVILVANGPENPNNCKVGMSAEEVSKNAAEDSLLVVNDPSPVPSSGMLDINLAMLEIARIPWLRKSVFCRPLEDKK